MKTIKKLLPLIVLVITLASCSRVPAGNVGIKFYLLGGDKGVDHEELSPGRYYIGINEELYTFPTFTQNYVWTKDAEDTSPEDESFNFQDKNGLELNADIGITYHLDKTKIATIFETYKRGIDEITDVFLRNMVRDELVSVTSKLEAEFIYGQGRAAVLDSVQRIVRQECFEQGIIIDKLYWIGRIKLPDAIKKAINNKIKATQKSQQRENEVRQSEAEADKLVAKAEGQAKAILLKAEAQAEANRILNASITPNLIRYKQALKWNGKLPVYSGVEQGIINMR